MAELPPRKQVFTFTLEDMLGEANGEPTLLLENDFRLGE